MITYLGNVLNRLPEWDTLFGVANLEDAPVTARFRFWNEADGLPVLWPNGETFCDVKIGAGLSHAMTFLPGNGFPGCPTPFSGHGTIETFRRVTPWGNNPAVGTYVWSMLSDERWCDRSPSIEAPLREQLGNRTHWIFPYVIPKWEYPVEGETAPPGSATHCGTDAYETGLLISSFQDTPARVKVEYTINQCYDDPGKVYAAELDILPNGGIRKLLSEIFPDLPIRSEGHLVITSEVPARLFPSVIVATSDFVFSAGQGFQ